MGTGDLGTLLFHHLAPPPFFFFDWVQYTLLMVHDKVGLPKPLPFLRVWDVNWRSGVSQCVGGLSGGRDSPAAEGLSLPLILAGAGGPGGSCLLYTSDAADDRFLV